MIRVILGRAKMLFPCKGPACCCGVVKGIGKMLVSMGIRHKACAAEGRIESSPRIQEAEIGK